MHPAEFYHRGWVPVRGAAPSRVDHVLGPLDERSPQLIARELARGPREDPHGRGNAADLQPNENSLSLPRRSQAFELLEPVLDEDELDHGEGLSLLRFHHEELLPVGRDVPATGRAGLETVLNCE